MDYIAEKLNVSTADLTSTLDRMSKNGGTLNDDHYGGPNSMSIGKNTDYFQTSTSRVTTDENGKTKYLSEKEWNGQETSVFVEYFISFYIGMIDRNFFIFFKCDAIQTGRRFTL